MFHSPSFLLSRLHSPPPQSNWFRSTSWGGYGVGMWAFCFHLSVNSDASKKKEKDSTSSQPLRLGSQKSQRYSSELVAIMQCFQNVWMLMRGFWRTAEDWHMDEMKKTTHCERILRCLPGVCLTVVLSRHDILEQLSPCYPEICKDKGQNATSHSIHSAEGERGRERETGGCPH